MQHFQNWNNFWGQSHVKLIEQKKLVYLQWDQMKIAGGLTMLLLLVHATTEEEDEQEKGDEKDDSGDSRPQLPPGEYFLMKVIL